MGHKLAQVHACVIYLCKGLGAASFGPNCLKLCERRLAGLLRSRFGGTVRPPSGRNFLAAIVRPVCQRGGAPASRRTGGALRRALPAARADGRARSTSDGRPHTHTRTGGLNLSRSRAAMRHRADTGRASRNRPMRKARMLIVVGRPKFAGLKLEPPVWA